MDENETKSQSPIIYTGPSHVGLGLRHNAVYRGELPGYITAMISEYELASKFFVDVESYASGAGVYAVGSTEYESMMKLLNDISRKGA